AVFTMVEGKGLDALGVRPAQLVGRPVSELYADVPQAEADVSRALAGDTFSSTVEVYGVVFDIWYTPIREANGEVSGVIGAPVDGADAVEGVGVMGRRRDGRRILVRLAGRAVRRPDGGGRIECFETLAEDVTERRALEEQLRQSQKMEAVGQLTGGIAHDFNNLLTIILANAQLIAKALPPEQADAHTDLRDVMAAALRGRVMVKELLGFARRSSLDL